MTLRIKEIDFKDKYNLNLFMVAYYIFFLGYIITTTTISKLIPSTGLELLVLIQKYVPIFILFLVILKNKYYSKKQFIVMSITLTSIIFSLILTHSGLGILTSCLFIFASKELDKEKFYVHATIIVFVCLIFITLLALAGIINNKIEYRNDGNMTVRNYLGFEHPNSVGMLSFELVALLEYIGLKCKKIKKMFVLQVFLIAFVIFFYMLTNASTFLVSSFAVILITVFFILLSSIKGKLDFDFQFSYKQKKRIFCFFMIAALVVVIMFMKYIWDNPGSLSRKFSTFEVRFSYAKLYLKAYGIKLFGSPIVYGNSVRLPDMITNKPMYLDNGFINYLISYGIVNFVIMIYMLVEYVLCLLKKNDIYMILFFFVLIMYFFEESGMNGIIFNIFIIELSSSLYKTNSLSKGSFLYDK